MGKQISAKGIQSKREKKSQIFEAALMVSISSELSFILWPLHLLSLFTYMTFCIFCTAFHWKISNPFQTVSQILC